MLSDLRSMARWLLRRWRRTAAAPATPRRPRRVAPPGAKAPDWLVEIHLDSVKATAGSPEWKVARVSHPFFGGERRPDWAFDLHPNAATAVLKVTTPAAVVVDASAAMPGSPWAGGGSEIDPARTWAVVNVIDTARDLGVPTLFRWDIPSHLAPALHRVAAACDVTATADQLTHGVSLTEERSTGSGVAVFETASPFGDRASTPLSLQEPGAREQVAVTAPMIHDPTRMKRALETCSVALFPRGTGPELVVLEALALGVAVVGVEGLDLPGVYSAPRAVDAAFLHRVAVDPLDWVERARDLLLAHHSTETEARLLGRRVGVPGHELLGDRS